MANYQDKVTIETTVNGQQAEDELKKLRQQAIELKEKIAEVYKTQGKSGTYDSLNKELNKAKRNIVEVQKQMYDVNRTLNNLSSASVRDLRRASALCLAAAMLFGKPTFFCTFNFQLNFVPLQVDVLVQKCFLPTS